MTKKIEKVAKSYQELDRQIKDLQGRQKPLKSELVKYAKEHKTDFDEAFQLKFANGTYISQRVSDVVEGTKEAKQKFVEQTADEYADLKLNEKAVIAEAPKNNRLRKLLTKLGLSIGQKESFAVYAG